MNPSHDEYASALANNRILFLPACIVVSRMLRLYAGLASLPPVREGVRAAFPGLMDLLGEMTRDLALTSAFHRRPNTGFFPGDWQSDKKCARDLFSRTAARLGQMHGLLDPEEQGALSGAIDSLTGEWAGLDGVLEEKARSYRGVCRYFHNANSGTWSRTMANVLLALDEDADYGEDGFLILLCNAAMRRHLLAAIREIGGHSIFANRFRSARILSVAAEETETTCPRCLGDMSRIDGIPVNIHGAHCRLSPERKARISLKKASESPASTADFQRRLSDTVFSIPRH